LKECIQTWLSSPQVQQDTMLSDALRTTEAIRFLALTHAKNMKAVHTPDDIDASQPALWRVAQSTMLSESFEDSLARRIYSRWMN